MVDLRPWVAPSATGQGDEIRHPPVDKDKPLISIMRARSAPRRASSC
jgi:hypothetical protein